MLSLSLINKQKLFKLQENLGMEKNSTDSESIKPPRNQTNPSTVASSFRIDDILVKSAGSEEKTSKIDEQKTSDSNSMLQQQQHYPLMSTLSTIYDMSCYFPPSMNALINKNSQQFMPLIYNSKLIDN